MTPDMSRRYALALFLALSVAVGVGLLSLPAFDPTLPLRPWLGTWASGCVLATAAFIGGHLTLRQLGRAHPAWSLRLPRAVMWLAWGLAQSTWLLGLLQGQTADGRALLWLALSPLWLAASGLWGRSGPGSETVSRLRPPQGLPQRGDGGGVIDHVDVRRPLDVKLPGTSQQRIRGREDDVVAMAVEAEEPFAA